MSTKKELKTKKAVLVIAGSDSSGGAGLQADIKTLQALNFYAATVITSVTSQSSLGVLERYDLPVDIIVSQFKAVTSDLKLQAVKIGMLGKAKTVKTVAKLLAASGLKNIVLDPVINAHTGAELLTKDGVASLKELWSLADIVTPNSFEAEQLLNIKINSLEEQKQAAQKACQLGAKAVAIKGGHLASKIINDVLYNGSRFWVFKAPNVGYKAHGAGCCFSTALAAFLAEGASLPEAVRQAHSFTQQAIKNATRQGKGLLIVNPS